MTALINKIRESVIGDNQAIETPFGVKPLVYADYTASGRALGFIEDIIRDQVLPNYANTHTETSYTGAMTTALREEARQTIREAVNGTDQDKVIFCGSGATSAVHKLIDILNLRLPCELKDKYQFEKAIPESERPVVFIGCYEHHSNELPWRESIADVEVVPLTEQGLFDIEALEKLIEKYQDRPLKIGSFSAASNVTGLKTDVDKISALLHRNNVLSFWDYAAASPYVAINMSDSSEIEGNSSKDAVFLSPHKFIGGPGTPGVLIVKGHVLKNKVPAMTGGGTVMYVTPEDHQYVANPERKEEGGTPAIVESIRAGLVFKLQQQVGTNVIEKREEKFVKRAISRWSKHSNIKVLGNLEAPRLSIVSFRITQDDKSLHYGYVVALLNDLFGIQARGGCSCAGPYAHHLLEMDMGYSKAIEEQLANGEMVLRPGWVRVNFNYFIDENTFEYIVRAVELIAEHGAKLMPYYYFDQTKGLWRYQKSNMQKALSIKSLDFEKLGQLDTTELIATEQFSKHMQDAENELTRENREGERYRLELSEVAESLRWFVLPQEAA